MQIQLKTGFRDTPSVRGGRRGACQTAPEFSVAVWVKQLWRHFRYTVGLSRWVSVGWEPWCSLWEDMGRARSRKRPKVGLEDWKWRNLQEFIISETHDCQSVCVCHARTHTHTHPFLVLLTKEDQKQRYPRSPEQLTTGTDIATFLLKGTSLREITDLKAEARKIQEDIWNILFYTRE